jgi:hypothetical protein
MGIIGEPKPAPVCSKPCTKPGGCCVRRVIRAYRPGDLLAVGLGDLRGGSAPRGGFGLAALMVAGDLGRRKARWFGC